MLSKKINQNMLGKQVREKPQNFKSNDLSIPKDTIILKTLSPRASLLPISIFNFQFYYKNHFISPCFLFLQFYIGISEKHSLTYSLFFVQNFENKK